LQVAVQGPGHDAEPLGDLAGSVLLVTSGMTGVAVDPVAGRARVGAGALWQDVVGEAARRGVSVLHGFAPEVGVVGQSLGGGVGWCARTLGLQANAVTAAEVVTADGSIVQANPTHHGDLFWALRGGGGPFGVVTELEFATFPFTTAYAGMLLWDGREAARVLARWAGWTASTPESVTTSYRLLEELGGRRVVVIDGAVLGDDDAVAASALAELRALGPKLDTFSRIGAPGLLRLRTELRTERDPAEPAPSVCRSTLLETFDAEAVEAFLRAAGAGSGSRLVGAELRQLGGALSRPAPGSGALSCLDGAFELLARGSGAIGLIETMGPWASASRFSPAARARLATVRARLDPHGVFRSDHVVPSGRTLVRGSPRTYAARGERM